MQHKVQKPPRKPSMQMPTWAIARYRHQQAIYGACERIDQARDALHEASSELRNLIEQQDPKGEWRERWHAFQAAGGVTFAEFCRWRVSGQQIRPVSKQRGQLRLIDVGVVGELPV